MREGGGKEGSSKRKDNMRLPEHLQKTTFDLRETTRKREKGEKERKSIDGKSLSKPNKTKQRKKMNLR